MPGKAAKIKVTQRHVEILREIAAAPTSEVRLGIRAKIIIAGFAGLHNQEIAKQVHLSRRQVGLWRRRWACSFEALLAIESREADHVLKRAICQVLSDAPRSGAPFTFTGQQVTQVLAVACEFAADSRRPVNHWTHRELADEVVNRGIVSSISRSQVGHLLAQAELQPHRRKYWLNPTVTCQATFDRQLQEVCNTYMQAPELYAQSRTHTVSVDEMPGIQAIERIAPTQPVQPGKPMRIEYEYRRHGTLCLIGNWHIATGQMIAPTINATRTEQDFVEHIHQTIQTDPTANWIFVMDNLNIHCSESLVRYVARLENVDEASLGVKGKSGILKTISTRQEFLTGKQRRIRVVYTPKHSSWLNQIEIVFGIVHRRAIAGGSFRSLQELTDRLTEFIDYFNKTFARPFRWTYTGRPVKAKPIPRPSTWREKWATFGKNRQNLALVV